MEGDDEFMVFVYCIGAMILVNRHTEAGGAPFRATLRIMPVSSVVLFDVRSRLREEFGSDFTRYSKEFYISDHTTAGYLDQRSSNCLNTTTTTSRITLRSSLPTPATSTTNSTCGPLRPATRRRTA